MQIICEYYLILLLFPTSFQTGNLFMPLSVLKVLLSYNYKGSKSRINALLNPPCITHLNT